MTKGSRRWVEARANWKLDLKYTFCVWLADRLKLFTRHNHQFQDALKLRWILVQNLNSESYVILMVVAQSSGSFDKTSVTLPIWFQFCNTSNHSMMWSSVLVQNSCLNWINSYKDLPLALSNYIFYLLMSHIKSGQWFLSDVK